MMLPAWYDAFIAPKLSGTMTVPYENKGCWRWALIDHCRVVYLRLNMGWLSYSPMINGLSSLFPKFNCYSWWSILFFPHTLLNDMIILSVHHGPLYPISYPDIPSSSINEPTFQSTCMFQDHVISILTLLQSSII